MDGAKKLTGLELDNYQYPLADVSHLAEEEKKELFKRGMCIPKQLKSDDEFEQWVSLYALRAVSYTHLDVYKRQMQT